MATQKKYTWEEVAKHNTEEDLWIVINNEIFAPKKYLDDHPGGPVVIASRGGKDAT